MSKTLKEEKRRYQSKLKKKVRFSTNNIINKNLRTKDISSKPSKIWTKEEDTILSNLACMKVKNFTDISKKIPGHSSAQCRKRWSKIKQGIKKGQWSLHEDRLLKEWIEKNGPTKWEQCGRFIHGRSGKQCREHWSNCLNPSLIKGDWTAEEDFLIMHFYEKCNGSWKKIIHLFNGRTENSIKNRFFSELRKIAAKGLTMTEKKNCNKIKLEELRNYLEEAIINTKKEFLEEKPMTEEELNIYLNKMELKIKKKMKEENDYYECSLSTNLGDLENNGANLKNENKDTTFIKKRNRTIDENLDNTEKEKNSLNKISNFEEEVQESNNMMDLDENYKKTFNNQVSTNENNEFKLGFEKDINISNINNNEIFNDKKEEEKKEDDNNSFITETNINYRNSNAFDIKFNDFLNPKEEFPEKGISLRVDSNDNFLFFDDNGFGFYSKPSVDFIEEKKDLCIYEKNINLF
jgi:hypothetical protein